MKKSSSFRSQSGQVVVEYVLLLIVAVTIAFVIRTALLKKGETAQDSGILIQRWHDIDTAIGADDPNTRQ